MYYNITIDKADMRMLESKLRNMEKDTPRHLRNAINRTVTQAVRQIKSGRKNSYTIGARRFNSAITVQKATASHLDASIKSAERPPTVRNFKTSETKRSGVKVDIDKTGLKVLEKKGAYSKAFIPGGGKLSGIVTQRRINHTGKKGGHFRVPYGPSVPKMIEKIWEGERGGQGNLQKTVQERLHKEIQAEIAKII